MSTDVLKPCPFCGGAPMPPTGVLRAGYVDQGDSDALAYTVRCRACAAEGGWTKSPTSAATSWNLRTALGAVEGERIEGWAWDDDVEWILSPKGVGPRDARPATLIIHAERPAPPEPQEPSEPSMDDYTFDQSTHLGQWQAWLTNDHAQIKARVAALEDAVLRENWYGREDSILASVGPSAPGAHREPTMPSVASTGASVVPIESLAPYDPEKHGPPSWFADLNAGTASSREQFNQQVEEYRAYLRDKGGPHAIADPGVDG
jgi:hypothetical protein